MKRKELFWFLVTFGLGLIVAIFLFGPNGFNSDATSDINIHDTYFVISNVQLIPFIFVIIYFIVYLLRAFSGNFKSLTTSLFLATTTILLIILLGKTSAMLDLFNKPINGEIVFAEGGPVEKLMSIASNFMFIIQIVLLILLFFCGYKTGRNFNTEKKSI